MHKISIITALSVFLVGPANAETLTAKETEALVPQSESQRQNRFDFSSDEALDLAAYGDRFQAAIRLFEVESAKPEWGWEDDCDHTAQHHDGMLNW